MASETNESHDASMRAERWQRIKSVLSVVLETDPSERSSYLDWACADDLSLRVEVEDLLAFEKQGLTSLPGGPPTNLSAESGDGRNVRIGQRVGPYQLVEEIGIGGMGEVYRAFRDDDQYKKEVAIKLVRTGWDSQFVIARFKQERQVLASLDHPNIARLLDGGTTNDGIPYFVMEFIDGQSLTEYCDRQKLATTERLKLFLQVCSAVQYAHQRLIIHRDLKPGNILVTGDGTPKLLDFGIAKILAQIDAPENPEATMSTFRLLTPAYASPEQVKGDAITTASDVYSLGVILYECLTGHGAYPARAQAPHEISRAICEVEPEKPSTVIRQTEPRNAADPTSEVTPASVSMVRDGAVEKLAKRLRGDIDNIVLMALRKEPQRRYASVEQLSTDIRRHLEHLPVIASKDTIRYRTAKFVARHSGAVFAAVALFLVVLSGVAATLYEAHRARQNEMRAEKRFDDVRALANSLLFDIHDSIRDLPGSTPARKLIVERALRYLDRLASETGGDPSLLRELATAYERVGEVQGDYIRFNVGETENALHSYEKALTLRKNLAALRSATWQDRLALARSYRLVAAQMNVTGNLPAAFQNAEKAVSIGESLRDKHPQDTQVLDELRIAYERKGHIQRGSWTRASPGDNGTALETLRKAMEIDATLLKLEPNNEDFQSRAGVDEMYYAEVLPPDRHAEKLQHFQNVLEIDKKINAHSPSIENARNVAGVYNRIATWYDDQRDHVKSAENHRHDLEIVEDLYAADPKNVVLKEEVVIASANLGIELGFLGQKNEGQRLLDRAVTLIRSMAQADPQNRSHQGMLAAGLVMRGDNFLYWKNFKRGLDDFGAASGVYRQLLAANPNNMVAQQRLLICRIVMAHTNLLRPGALRATGELERALADSNSLLSDTNLSDETLYAAAVGYADLGNVEFAAARSPATGASKLHWEAAARWYGLSLSTLKRVQDLAGQSESEAFGALDPAVLSKRLAICQSAEKSASDLATRAH